MEVESTTSHTNLCYNSATSHLQILDSHPAIIDSGITSPASPLAFSTYSAASTTNDLVQFLHATCFSPVQSTLIKAINNSHFATWPSFTAANIRRFLPKSPATTMGHLDQV
jgi:hypothetical protein